ncbi:MAG: serine/threonine protein kinase [Victivallales bacterium]|nr:serine/threonine protein kinase [Victivallales bacterium]
MQNKLTYAKFGKFAEGGMASLTSIVLGDGTRALLRELHTAKILSFKDHGRFRFGTKVRSMLSPHPNIVNSLEIGYHGLRPYEIIELLEGQNLKALVNNHSETLQKHMLFILVEAAEALAWVHQNGFMHLDVKPENFLVKESGGGLPIVKLTDFDLSKKSDDNGPYPQPGTPNYMAPEQFKEKKAYQSSDVFAFCLMMYRIVTGKAAFVADTKKKLLHLQASSVQTARHPQDIDPTLNPALCAILMKGLSKKRELRYPDMMALAMELKKKVESIHI